MTTLCLSNVIALSASDRPAKRQLSPKMQNACSSTHTHTPHASDRPAKKQLSPRDAILAVVPQLHLMACANYEARPLPLWLFPLFCVGGSARHIICFPLVHSNLPKRGRSAKDCSTLLQLLLALRIWNRPPFIRHIPLVSLHHFLHDKHQIPSMCSARRLHAHVDALSTNKSQLVAPHMPNSFGKLIGSPNEDCRRRSRHKLRHGCQTKLTCLHTKKLSQQYLLQCATSNKKTKCHPRDSVGANMNSCYPDLCMHIYLGRIFWHSAWHIFWHSFWHIFWHSFWHLSDISFDILSDVSFDTLSDDISSDILHIFRHSFWHIFWHSSDISSDISFWHFFWHIFCNLSDISSDILSDISFDILSAISSGISPDILWDIAFDILSGISSDILSDISFDILSVISSDILSVLSFAILSDISSGILFDIPFDILSDMSSDILSDISFDILSDISSDIIPDISFDSLSDISFDIPFRHIFWHSFWHLSDISFDIFSDISSDISFWHFFWHIFWHSFWHIFCHSFWQIFWHITWGPARNTDLTGSRLRSGTPHWTHRIAVEVRHATLNSQDRGWGPARHTELTGSRLRSGTPHWTHRIAVEVRHATLNSQDRGWGPARHTELTGSQLRRTTGGGGRRSSADIKSNNPHLTGGEKQHLTRLPTLSDSRMWPEAS